MKKKQEYPGAFKVDPKSPSPIINFEHDPSNFKPLPPPIEELDYFKSMTANYTFILDFTNPEIAKYSDEDLAIEIFGRTVSLLPVDPELQVEAYTNHIYQRIDPICIIDRLPYNNDDYFTIAVKLHYRNRFGKDEDINNAVGRYSNILALLHLCDIEMIREYIIFGNIFGMWGI